MRQLHGRIGKRTSAVSPSDQPGVSITNAYDLIPKPCHVARRQDAQRENDARHVSIEQRLIVDFFATDRFDRQNIGARLGTELQGTQQLLTPFAAAQRGWLPLLTNVGGSNS